MSFRRIVIDRRAEAGELPSSTPSVSPSSHSPEPRVIVEVLISIGGALVLIGLLGGVFFLVSRCRRRRARIGSHSSPGTVKAKCELPHHLGHERWMSEASFSVPFLDGEKRTPSYESMRKSEKGSDESTEEGYLRQGYLSISLDDAEAAPSYSIPVLHDTQKSLPWPPLSPGRQSPPQRQVSTREASTSTQTDATCDSNDSESMYSQRSVRSTRSVASSTLQSFPVPPLPPVLSPHISPPAPQLNIPQLHLHVSEDRPIERSDTVVISRLLKARMSYPLASLARSGTQVSHIERSGSIKTITSDEHRKMGPNPS